MTDVQYLIIGNGVAGITAAQEIRHADPTGHLLITSDEDEAYYYRASLSEWISGQTTDDMLPGRTPEFYDHMHIEQITGHVTRLDPEAHRAHLDSGDHIDYAKVLIATGARANITSIPGLEESLVFRTLADARQIKQRLGCCGRALIVGGGVLGLELAGALHKMGIPHIAVVQRSAPIGKPLLDAPAAAWLQQRMRVDGVDLFVNDTVERVEGQTAHLKSGSTWDFDAFVQAAGITPVFPEIPGLDVSKGIRIDDHCNTNLPDISAAGDCTETRVLGRDRWQTTRIWLDCARQGKVAGCNMAGGDATLHEKPFFNASVLYTVFYTYVGQPHAEGRQKASGGQETSEEEIFIWQEKDGYRKFRVVDGRLAGAFLLGERHGSMALIEAIGKPVAQFGPQIAHPNFPYNELTGQNWDYLFY
jgi:NADPH-dependent 2,4-dienoyl-CoA reductase/sulfur reductase-like enzyme